MESLIFNPLHLQLKGSRGGDYKATASQNRQYCNTDGPNGLIIRQLHVCQKPVKEDLGCFWLVWSPCDVAELVVSF